MSDPSNSDARPSKRVRLDDSTSTSIPSAPASPPQAPQAPTAPIPTDTPKNDSDVERERRAGITEYVCPGNLGFSGVLKQRYTDFLVNEIGLDGEVLHLRTLGNAGTEEVKVQEREKKNGGEKVKVEENGTNGEVGKEEAEKVTKKEVDGDVEMRDAEAAKKDNGAALKNGAGEEGVTVKQEDVPKAKIKFKVDDNSDEEGPAQACLTYSFSPSCTNNLEAI